MPALTAPTLAHGADAAGDRWSALLAYLTLAMLAAWYGRGVHELWRRRGTGAVVPVWRVLAFAAGVGAAAVASGPPVHELAEDSFAGHMAQHMIFLVVVGPLLAAGAAGVPLIVAVPAPVRRLAGRARLRLGWLRRPVSRAIVAGMVQTAVVLVWHLPDPYLLALRSQPVHAAEHACFVGASWLVWSCVLAPGRHRLPGPAGLLLIFASGMPAAGLGIVLSLAPTPLYPMRALAPHGGGAVAAQQFGGLVMWAPMEAVTLGLAIAVFLTWLVGLERRLPATSTMLAPSEEVVRS